MGLLIVVERARGVGLIIVRSIAGGVEILAPAKLNLFLEVLGRRPDGYHEIETVMVAVSLNDTLTFLDDPSGGISLRCSDPSLLIAQFVGLPFDGVNDGILRSVSRSVEPPGCVTAIVPVSRFDALPAWGAHRAQQGDPDPGRAGWRLERRRRDDRRPRSALGSRDPPRAEGCPRGGGR